MNDIRIDFNKPCLEGNELAYIQEAFRRAHISGDGHFTKLCQGFLETELNIPKAILTTSCTHALEMMAFLLDIKSGDEIIVPSFTFVSTVNAFTIRGAKPVFIDIRPDTLNLDENLLESKITKNTKAIVVVHYAGVACNMDAILKIAADHQVPVLEDNAHGLFGKYKEQFLGSFGCFASQSFHETKNFTCGEGGAILINDPQFIERAEIIREKGTNRSRFFRGMVDKYTWVDMGSSYLPSDILAAVLFGQFEKRSEIQSQRKAIWEYYHSNLRDWCKNLGARQPIIPPDCQQAYHMYYLLMPDLDSRQALIQHLKKKGIISVFHYLPLHLSEMGIRYGGKKGDAPVTEKISDCLIRLPFYNNLSLAEQDVVMEEIYKF
jgi:dTDP-4-amino-4,6-dideoxygalactose transaminase